MARNFYRFGDADFFSASANFATMIAALPGDLGLTAQQAAAYQVANDRFAAAYQEAINPGTRTRGKVLTKTELKAVACSLAMQLAAIIKATPTVTDEQLVDLGLTPRAQRHPRPRPGKAGLTILSMDGKVLTGRLFDPDDTGRRGMPPGADGAAILYFVGDQPAGNTKDWTFVGLVSRSLFTVTFPETLGPGTKVWVTGYFFNARKESGLASDPQSTYVGGGLSSAA